ncbi:hypothetical protein PHYSODRAFT_332399 [Phytophthora sojae]|uniref:Uncharacterized protein n=1 Tax=Phytophthora sojae (strain P6497) TaxID=1094619 RepID=G4ZH28_PHYSP|nr:hypothetical protein PHYSODRAFT_332399 [Phytophthora sojae]EGZ18653.1 hypothetical protein PHYSODRAFT_332399 [Phytophthora sojae]|eukprot:XP_009527711.1 hypothetical protein PHYSODRAFT_332399 [Phytophthora sojae]
MRGHIAISQIVKMAESATLDGKQETAPAQGTAPPGSTPPPTQQRTGDAPASTAPAGGGSGQAGNSASGDTSTDSTKTGATTRRFTVSPRVSPEYHVSLWVIVTPEC